MSFEQKLLRIDELQHKINGFGKLPDTVLKKINYKFRLEWNYTSNSMEGNTLTKEETRSVMIGNITVEGKPIKDILEMKGHDEVINTILKIGKSELNISEKRIKEMHIGIMHEENPEKKKAIGQWKTVQNYLYNYRNERFDFVAPVEVPDRMHQLINWLNAEKDKIQRKLPSALHPVELALKFNLDYVTIHPFYDGNGRTSRILTNLILISYGYPPLYIKENERRPYYQYLGDIQGYGGDSDVFFDYMAGLVIRSQQLVLDAVEEQETEDDIVKTMEEEAVIDVGKRILSRTEAEFINAIPNKTIAHAAINLDGNEMLVWLVGREIRGSTVFSIDINGNINPNSFTQGKSDVLRSGGAAVISRNSKLGGFLIINRLGAHKYHTPKNGTKPLDVFSFSQYVPKENFEYDDDVNGFIQLVSGETKFTSLRSLLNELDDLENQHRNLLDRKIEEGDTEALILKIAELETRIKIEKEGIKRYINKNVELRYLPILDPQQEIVKRSSALKGSLIINGGPGTGKTTTLIQRIKYLTSIDILDNEIGLILSEDDKELLFDQRRSWVFFSPTELLKDYLKEAMNREGLDATDETAVEWNSFLVKKIREYRIVNTETNRPFLFLKNDNSYFNLGINLTEKLLRKFDEYYFQYNVAKIEKIKSIDIKGKSWEKIAIEIIGFTNNIPKKLEYSSLVRLYFNLNQKFEDSSNEINETFKRLLETSVGQLMTKIKKDDDLAKWFDIELRILKQFKNQNDEDEDEDDELEADNFEEISEVVQHFNFDLELSRRLKGLTRKVALRKFDINTKLTKKDRPFYDKLVGLFNDTLLTEIGEKALFKKYFDRLTKGVEVNMLREISTIYKKFRKEVLNDSDFLTSEGLTTIDRIFKNRNLHLHKEESSLLLLKINNIIKEIYQSLNQLYYNSTNTFIRVYRDTAKAVVAIDEATDFTGIDLACMGSFSHPRFNSVTLCGDIMQRLEKTGINSWDEYKILIKNTVQMDLLISFRQTPLLFELARKLYVQNTKSEPEFRSYQAPDVNDPKPLLFISSDKEETANWIGDRIKEIHDRYQGNTPSIAVFVADESEIMSVTKLINGHEKLESFGIKAVECLQGRVLGSANNVRVYSVKYIKGLEFEAVFFVGSDEIIHEHEDLVDKYLYVGLSRATYFLAITANNNLPERLNVIKQDLVIDGNWEMV